MDFRDIKTYPEDVMAWYNRSMAAVRIRENLEPHEDDDQPYFPKDLARNPDRYISADDVFPEISSILSANAGYEHEIDRATMELPQQNIVARQREEFDEAWHDLRVWLQHHWIANLASFTARQERAQEVWERTGEWIIPNQILVPPGHPDHYQHCRDEYARIVDQVNTAYTPLVRHKREWKDRLWAASRVDSDEEFVRAHRQYVEAMAPEHEGGSPKMPRGQLCIGFGSKLSGIQGNWQAVDFDHTVGGGNFGVVTLWIKHDANGNQTEAMALKECRWGPEGPPRVRDAYGNVRIVEINCHEQLASLHDQDGIVGFFGSGVWEEHGLHRIYLEYGGRDDLNALIRAHNSYIWRSEDDVAESGKAIPPVIIWNIFQALAAALCLFQSGSLPGNQRQGGYRSLVHLDIKPANVFLASRRSASPWPTVRTMLGDFGLMLPVGHPEFVNPRDYRGAGTLDFQAPEQIDNEEAEGRGFRVECAADIFVIGSIMIMLMTRNNDHMPFPFRDGPFDNLATPLDHLDLEELSDLKLFYGSSIFKLIKRCTQLDPNDRISADDLYKEIERITSERRDWNYDGDTTPMRERQLREDEVFLAKADTHAALARS